MGKLASWLERMTANPPWYLRLVYVPLFATMAVAVAARRGWVIGLVAGVVFGGLGLAMAFAPGGVVDWSRRHPRMDGAFFGPLLFLGLVYLTSVPIWVCLAVGIVGVGLGVLMGIRRERQIGVGDQGL